MSDPRERVSRRRALSGAGALIVSFSLGRVPLAQELAPAAPAQPPQQRLAGSLRGSPVLDAWIRIDAQGITVFTGKVELGQGIKTALLQVAAEVVVAAHLHAEHVELGRRVLDDRHLLAIEESDLDHRQIVRIGEQVPRRP